MKTGSRTKYTVLGMLVLENLTGYEIIKMIQSSTNYFWSESEGQIYPALAQCLEEGFVTCKEAQSEKVNRTKKIYAITTRGKKELKAWLQKEPQPALIRNELLLKLFFGANIHSKDNMHHVMHHQKALENEMQTYQTIREELVLEHKNSPHLKYWLITLDFGMKSTKAELAWCKDTLKILESI